MVPEKLTLWTRFGCFTDIRFFINSTCIENLNPFWHDLHRTDQEKKNFFGDDHDTEKKKNEMWVVQSKLILDYESLIENVL
jgi:hypothetical protein